MIFGVWNPEKTWHRQLVHFPTLPVYCNHFTLGNLKKSFFNSITVYSNRDVRRHKRETYRHWHMTESERSRQQARSSIWTLKIHTANKRNNKIMKQPKTKHSLIQYMSFYIILRMKFSSHSREFGAKTEFVSSERVSTVRVVGWEKLVQDVNHT